MTYIYDMTHSCHMNEFDPALTNLLDVLHDEGNDDVGLQK